jgi:hypothetical protein
MKKEKLTTTNKIGLSFGILSLLFLIVFTPISIGFQETIDNDEEIRPPYVNGFIIGRYTEKYDVPGSTVFKCNEFDIIIFGLFYFEPVLSFVEIGEFYGIARNGRIFGYGVAMLVDYPYK